MGADGTEYTGEQVEDYLDCYENSVVSFTFPDAPPGKYTLKLPYAYMLLKQEESLTWNLLSGKPSRQVISFPGGSIRTASITELEEPVQIGQVVDGVPVVITHTWEIAVQCAFDNQEITAVRGAHPDFPDLLPRVKAESMARFLLYGERTVDSGSVSYGFRQRDPESENLIYQIYADDRGFLCHDFRHVGCNPAQTETYRGRMVLRYDHPMELEFEVTE